MSDEHVEYLAVLKASYDYEPQSDDEIAIKEDQILILKERVDDDWWKVKVKGDTQEEDSPVGLVPAAYVEQANHTSKVKVLYDYEAAASGELSVHEDEVLLVFETEEDWILAQTERDGGKAGYVPGNYVEPYTEATAAPTQRIIVPPSPPRPVSTYVDPADRVASAKITVDEIKTWSVSEIDKKGKKKKGTLGIGNGAVFFASESDKTPVQKWQTVDVQAATSDKAKHVNIVIGGATPITLHFQTGSKDTVEEIISKLNSVPKKPSVHFSETSPTIIPARASISSEVEVEDEDEESNTNGVSVNGASHGETRETGLALYDFVADGDDELTISEGEHLVILEKDGDEWWKCRNDKGQEGVVPASYLEVSTAAHSGSGSPPPSPTPEEDDGAEEAAEAERQRAEEERAAEERERQRVEQAKKKAEAQAQKRAKEAAEERKRKEAANRKSSPPVTDKRNSTNSSRPGSSSDARPSTENSRPPADRTRVWHDRSGQFRVEAAFLGFNNGKLRLHKVNGVIVEVPSEKMSIEDMKYVERLTSKGARSTPNKQMSEDDIPLGLTRNASRSGPPPTATRSAPPKSAPKIDWFDFFLSAGCDLDDCTRYAASFERDKLDETLLPDITEATMRLLGVREGDIIRITKAIEKRKPTDNLQKPSAYTQEQVRRDEELARRLQAQESARGTAPNLFATPGGALKTQTRRGRPTTSASSPPVAVDIKAISSASEQIPRTSSPQVLTPTSAPISSNAANAPPRSSSAAPAVSGFDDDAWTNRPSSTKPLVGTPAPRVPSAPPVQPAAPPPPNPATVPAPAPVAPAPAPAVAQTSSAPPSTSATPAQPDNNLTNRTEADIFEQLARYGEMRNKQVTPVQPPSSTSPSITVPPSFQAGLGMGSSPAPMGQLLQAPLTIPQSASYNGPRGPFAPVPANQGLLQPLIPTRTGFTGMIPTHAPPASVSPFSNSASPPFLSQQPTGFSPALPLTTQPTGMPLNGFNTMQASSPFTPIQNQFTGFNPNFGQSPFNTSPPPVPPLPSAPSTTNDTSAANVFAQMKSGTFANDNNTNVQSPPAHYSLRQFLWHSLQDGLNRTTEDIQVTNAD
ncbi:hypothetical protein H0H92_000879 [Tricholoma furcatifolium]|nr:hypothetical protein H0H92_000879 [Tricholoma furcatifolium]